MSSKSAATLPSTWSRTVRDNATPPGSAQRLQARGDIDAIAVDVVALDDDFAEIDADAIADPLVLADSVRLRVASWIAMRAIDRGNDAGELHQRAVAHQLEDAPAVLATQGSKMASGWP